MFSLLGRKEKFPIYFGTKSNASLKCNVDQDPITVLRNVNV